MLAKENAKVLRRNVLIEAVERYWTEHGQGPRRSDLADVTGWSRNTVASHVAHLLESKVLREEDGRRLRFWI